jgi:transitional endoplasmic reticulum ATPase
VISDAIREALQRNCVDLLAHAPLYRANGVPLRRGIVLHGPPGTGKTMIGRALAQRCGVTFILATPGMLNEPADVRRVFMWGRRFAPSILFFEDFDLVAGNRHNTGRREIVGEFLSCLDGVDSRDGIIAIATTNDLKAIEPALKERPNRFDCVLEIPVPAKPERLRLLQQWKDMAWARHEADVPASGDVAIADAPVAHSFDLERLADRTNGFTGAQLQELCRLAVFEAVEERIRVGHTSPERLPLSDAQFDAALKRIGHKRRRSVGFHTAE